MIINENGIVKLPQEIVKAFKGQEIIDIKKEKHRIVIEFTNPVLEEWNAYCTEAQAWAKKVGLTEQDIKDAIREVRRENAKNSIRY